MIYSLICLLAAIANIPFIIKNPYNPLSWIAFVFCFGAAIIIAIRK